MHHPENGINLAFSNRMNHFEINLICNINVENQIFKNLVMDDDYFIANIESKHGCPQVAQSILWFKFQLGRLYKIITYFLESQ